MSIRPQRQKFCSKLCSRRWIARHKPSFKGRRYVENGYVAIYLPNNPMAHRKGYVFEHRLVMSEQLGRPLRPDEVVDHINGIKDDNRPENLRVLLKKQHDVLPKPLRPIVCPNCSHTITVTGGLKVIAVTPPGRPHPMAPSDGTIREPALEAERGRLSPTG